MLARWLLRASVNVCVYMIFMHIDNNKANTTQKRLQNFVYFYAHTNKIQKKCDI